MVYDVHKHRDVHILIDVHVGVTLFAHFLMKKRSLEHLLSMMCALRSL